MHRAYRRATGRRLLAGLLAAILGVPFASASTLAAGVQPTACGQIWTSNQTGQRTVFPANGFTYTSRVTYSLGYSTCNLSTPNKVKVVSFSNTMKVVGGLATAKHRDIEAGVMLHFNRDNFVFPCNCTTWYDGLQIAHVGNGTWTRTRNPGVIQTYYRSAAVFGHWTGCDWAGVGRCRFGYRFLEGQLDFEWAF